MPNPSLKDESSTGICASNATPKREGRAHFRRCRGARAIHRKRAKELGMYGYSGQTKDKADQRARTGPAIGAPMVSVTNIRIIKNHPAPCQAHHTPWSRQTR